MANIKVAVRVRPISEREFTLTGSEVVVHTDQKKVSLTNLKVSSSKAGDSRERTRRYGFDYCFNSSDPESEENATQEKIYETLGNSVLDAIFSGYNACLIAYGQSASGKTYTMMGPKDDPGLTPRLCEGLFLRIFEEQKNDRTYQTSVSYLEVYNERVRDLLRPSSGSGGLRVREHPRLGPYVQGLTRHVVCTLGSLMSYVVEGTKARKTASTLQNPTSSRSHALLTVSLSENLQNGHPGTTEIKHFPRGSKLHLVDLAGSESAATCSGIHRLKEGANINKSLVALGNVISALAERGATGSGPGRRFIPYRDSALTWLLKDALGGNATTIMLATISPASGSYNETAHTLRFAQRAQSVVNRPVINEDPVARIIRELREEVSRLKSLLLEKSIEVDGKSICCCKHNEELEGKQDRRSTSEHQVAAIVEEGKKKEELNSAWNTSQNCSTIASVPVRRYNSNESLISVDTDTSTSIRRFGSFEFPVSESFFKERRYDRAEISELKYNEAEESVFVDIPTLVAVLIKPDDTLQERSTQIEEICSDGVLDNPIDTELLENSANGVQVSCSDVRSSNNDLAKLGDNDESSVRPSVDLVPFNSNKPEAESLDNSSQPRIKVIPDISSNRRNVGKLRKLESIDSTELEKSSNLQVSKKFGSVDALSKKREPLNSIQRSQTNLEKRFGNSDKVKKLNNIKEIEDQRSGGSGGLWQASGSCGSKDLQRKGSNDSGSSSQKLRNLPRKQSIDGLKRKTSKDSSSSSSKEDQILISNLARDKLRRKSSLDQEIENRSHTPIQRVNRRAEIVAAVTQRLYSSKRNSEEATTNTPGSEFHSSENSDVKLASTTRMRLQEISRKMLAKRRRICVDTQTDNPQTIRVKDTASLTDSLKVTCEDIGTLTDHHEDCESLSGTSSPVLRVKEMATLTEERRRSTVRCKDVAILTDDREEDYEIHSPRNDSGILSDDTQNYAESNLSSTEISDLCGESDSRLEGRNVEFVENSTNTSPMFADCVSSSTAQTDQRKNVGTRGFPVGCDSRARECCHGSVNNERNVISISLPDMIGITIESSNILESKIVIVDSTDVPEDKIKADLKDTGAQTDPKSMSECSTNTEECYSYVYFSDRSTSMKPSDDKIFRIENIFRDPKNCNRSCCMIDTPSDLMENALARNSFTFTNSVGTSFVPETKERSTEIEREGLHGLESVNEILRRGSLTIDRSTENALDVNEHSCKSSPRRWVSLSSIDCPTSETLLVLNSTEGIQLSTCKPEFEIQSIISKQVPNGSERLTDGDLVLLQEDRSLVRSSDPVKQYFEKIRNNGERSVDDRMDSKNSLESDANFSDDSLDLNESITRNDVTEVKTELRVGEIFKGNENYCPPDVVAHTNMDGSRSSSRSVEDVGSFGADQDFEDSYVVEFPKTNPNSIAFQMHDYKSLILGDPCFDPVNDQAQLDEDSSEDEVKRSVGKKRVSFSSSEVFSEGTQSPVCRYNNLPPKSIIKKKYSVSANPEGPALQKEHQDPVPKDTKDWSSCSVTENKSDVVFKPRSTSSKLDDPENFIVDSSGCQNSHEEHDRPLPSHRESANRKVRFSTSEGTTSDSDSYENYDNCDNCDKEPRDILVEYLDEAAAFMRNMNSMNEYMSATKLFERFFEDKSDRCCESDEHDLDDHVEYEGCRISLKDLDMSCDKCLKEDDFVVPVDSYENCLKGIERLESCIRKVKRHNEVLREKYGINVESADTKYRLVEPSIDSARLRLGLDYDSTLKEIEISNAISSSEELENIGRWKWKNDLTKDDEDHDEVVKNNRDHLDDLEERHFSNLMNESNLDRSKNLAKPRVRRSTRMSDLRSKSPSSYSRLRGNYRIQGSSPSFNYTENIQSSFESAKENRFEDSGRRNSSGFLIREQEDPRSTENGVGATKVLENLKTPDCFLFLPTTSVGNDFSRTNRSSSSPRRALYSKNEFSSDSTSSTDTIAASTESMDTLSNFRDGPKYPGSPRAKFLQLLSERRRIVQNSRSSSAY